MLAQSQVEALYREVLREQGYTEANIAEFYEIIHSFAVDSIIGDNKEEIKRRFLIKFNSKERKNTPTKVYTAHQRHIMEPLPQNPEILAEMIFDRLATQYNIIVGPQQRSLIIDEIGAPLSQIWDTFDLPRVTLTNHV